MDIQQRGIITLVKSAITGEKYSLPNDFDLTVAAQTGKKHGISAMLYYGAVNCGIEQSSPAMQEMFMYTCKSVFKGERQIYEIKRIFKAFDKEKIEYMPLKGIGLRNLYPKPEMRPMSDADILIKLSAYEKIQTVMLNLGFKDGGITDHEIKWHNPSLYVELHSRLIPSYNRDYYAYFGDGWQLATVCDGTRYSMTAEDQMVYLFTHFAKHYREAGIGIKHIVDIWVYRKNNPDLDEKYIKTELEKLQLYDFYVNSIATLSVWFNGDENTAVTELITDFIFNSGAGGTRENYLITSAIKASKKSGNIKNVRLVKVFNTIFLPYRKMCLIYPFLKKYPIFLPIMWAVRIISKLFKKNKLAEYKKDVESISDETVLNFQKSLNFVGLDFNFKE